MAYQSDLSGPFEPVVLNKKYRGIFLQSNATAVDITVTSGSATGIALHLVAGEQRTGEITVTAGTVTGLIGYTIEPNAGYTAG